MVGSKGNQMLWKYTQLCVVALTLCSSKAMAQQSTDPGRVDERLRPQTEVPTVQPLDMPATPQQATEADGSVRVVLTSIKFEGATAIPREVLDALATPYLGRELPLSELFRLTEEVTAEYRRRGFVLARAVVGPQRIENGVLTIQVVEGFVGQTRIEGDAGGYRPYLDAYLAPVRAGRPTNGDDLSRALLLARDLRGAEVRAVLTPSADTVGATDLTLVVERRPVEAYVAIDNRGSRWLGPLQIYGGITLNDAMGWGERIGIVGVAAPDQGGELGFVALSWEQPLGGPGLRAEVFASHARTRPGGELRTLGVEGESSTLGFGFQYPLVRRRDGNVFGRVEFTSRNSESGNFFLDPLFEDRTRTVSAQVIANQALPWGALVTARLSVTQGLGALGATSASDTGKSRATASGRFSRANGEIAFVQPLIAGFTLQLGATAQATSDSLLASEEFGVGGNQYGRAYDPSEITGDEGYAARAELFYTFPADGFGRIEPFFYYEGGQVRQNDPLPGEALRADLKSLGTGIRASMHGGIAASFEYAKPIGRDVAASGDRRGRMFVSISATY